MTLPEANNKLKHNTASQNRYLPIVLWVFPLLLLNIGWIFFNRIDYKWEEQERIEQAKQDVESLAANSEFSYCVGTLAGNFCEDLKAGAKSFPGEKNKNNFLTYVKNRASMKFRDPFPSHDLFVFQMPCKTNKPEIIFTNAENIKSKRAFGIAFEFLVRLNSEDPTYSDANKKKGADITKTIWGGEAEPDVIAETQRGKASFSFYKHIPNWFLWDYFKDEETDNVFGYFLIVDNNKATEAAARLIALRDLRNSQKKGEGRKYGAFIPLFAGYGGVVAEEELFKMPDFNNKVRKWIPENSKGIYDWQRNGAPLSLDETRVGNLRAYFHIAPGQSHAAVLLVPIVELSKMPNWLFLINIAVSCFVILLLLRGFLLGIWPKSSLRFRFISTYFLAACLPLGLLIIASYGYLSEYRHTALFQNQSQLRLCINQFDSRKTQTQDEYKTAFLDVLKDSVLLDYAKKLDEAGKEPINDFIPEVKAVLSRAIDIFNRDGRSLPLLSLTIVDERGGFATNVGNTHCQYYKNAEHKEFIPKETTFNYEQKRQKAFGEDSMEALLFPVLTSLRNRIEVLAPDSKKWTEAYKPTLIQETAVGAFKTAVGSGVGGLSEEFDKRRNTVITRLIGDRTLSHIHDYIFVDGVPRFVIFVIWDESSLDDKSFSNSLNHFALTNPKFAFTSYKATSQGLKKWLDSGRHSREFEKISQNLANQAYFRKSHASSRNDIMTVVAVPSKKYNDTIIVGGVSHHHIDMPVFIRLTICVAIIVIALIVLVACIYYSSKIFLKPIDNLKQSLDKVSEGKLDIEIKSHSIDEFGTMSHEFNKMTQGLNERNKLATLISDHAVEALSKNGLDSEASDIETFSGVALVSDIRNFTGMCETREPDQVTDLLNEHFARMTKIISANGGRIYKYIGDAVEVVFADKDDSGHTAVERSFNAACGMLECLHEINEERKSKGLFDYRIGIGLCYGKMTSGTIGSLDTRLDYAIIGDALKQAAKLESMTKQYPEFPLIADKPFVEAFSKVYYNSDFRKVIESESIDCFYTTEVSAEAFAEEYKQKLNNDSANSPIELKTEDVSADNQEYNKSFEIESTFSFWEKFIPGFIFTTVLSILMAAGIYFVYTTANNSEIINLSIDNQRDLEQILCDEYGKTAFDIKARKIATALNNDLKKLNEAEITDEAISESLSKALNADKITKSLGFCHAFIRAEDNTGYQLSSDTAFVDKLSVRCAYKDGFTGAEITKIVKSFKMCEALKILKDSAYAKFNENDPSMDAKRIEFQMPYLLYMKEHYGEPSRDVFGEKHPLVNFKLDPKNASVDCSIRGEDAYLFWLDYFIKTENGEKLIGYYICSMAAKPVKESIPMILSAYSKNDALIAVKNQQTKEWSFSDNVSEKMRRGILEADKKVDDNKENSEIKGNQYIFGILGAVNKGVLNIAGVHYDIYLTRLCELNKGNPRNALIIVFLVIAFLGYSLMKIAKGKSITNRSVAAKLWLALLIVAVIPVITVFFVFGLFRSEYYSVKTSQERSEMQRYSEIYELKEDFVSPLVWKYIRKMTASPELTEIASVLNDMKQPEEVRQKALVDLRKLTTSWLHSEKEYDDFEKEVINFSIADISVSGSQGWSFCYSDTKDTLDNGGLKLSDINGRENNDKLTNSVSYIDTINDNSRDSFGVMLKQIALSILNRRGKGRETTGVVNKDMVANEVAVETGLKAVRTFFGDDTFIRISHGVNMPTIMNVGVAKLGFYLSPIPDYEQPEFIIVWMVNFSCYHYLVKMANFINSKYNIHPAENFKYGEVVHSNDNDWRIPLGEYSAWIATSYLPISTNIKIDNQWYFIEGAPALRQLNAMLLLSCSEKEISNEIYNMGTVFYILLGISLLIIIGTTRNIADDILNPLKSLIEGIDEVNKENFTYRINSDRTDELGALCLSFDQMVKGLEEKQMISKMVSKTAQMVTLKEGADATRKAECVLLYVGIPDFSSWMAGLYDYEIIADLKKHTAIIAGIIMEEGGEVDKIMGEKLLAVFRVKDDEAPPVLAACRVAKRIVELENNSKLPFPVAIGINYGNVINGFLGVGNKRDFTVIGDAVNVTARIESLSEKLRFNRCLVSEAVYELICRDFTSKAYGEVELKGKSKPMKVYQLT